MCVWDLNYMLIHLTSCLHCLWFMAVFPTFRGSFGVECRCMWLNPMFGCRFVTSGRLCPGAELTNKLFWGNVCGPFDRVLVDVASRTSVRHTGLASHYTQFCLCSRGMYCCVLTRLRSIDVCSVSYFLALAFWHGVPCMFIHWWWLMCSWCSCFEYHFFDSR